MASQGAFRLLGEDNDKLESCIRQTPSKLSLFVVMVPGDHVAYPVYNKELCNRQQIQ